MRYIYKIFYLIIKDFSIFQIPILRNLRNHIYGFLFKAKYINVSDNVTITTAHKNKSAYFKTKGKLFIGSGTYIDYSGGILIEENVTISQNVNIFTHDHVLEGKKNWQLNPLKFSSLKLEKYCWVGEGSTILPNVKIVAEGSVIGAASVLTKDTEPYSIYVGNPAKKITKKIIYED